MLFQNVRTFNQEMVQEPDRWLPVEPRLPWTAGQLYH